MSGSSGLNFARLRTRFAEPRRHQHTATARTPGAQTMSLKETLSTYWVHLQAALLPWLDEAPDGPLTPRHKQLVAVLGLIRIEALLPSWPVLVGRPPAERAALARAFVAKAVFNFPTTHLLITLLASDKTLRQLCGWQRASDVPSEATFSRAFAEFANSALPSRLHAALIQHTHTDRLVGHVSRVDGGPDALFSGASHSSLCVGWRMDGGVLLGVMPSCRVVSG